MGNKRRILDKSLKLFNAKGLSSVSVRTICGALKISPGSFSYHFPDKRVIVLTLYEEMLEENRLALIKMSARKPNISLYLDTHRALFHNQEKYKFFYLNLFEILTNYEEIRQRYFESERSNLQLARQMLDFYVLQGIMKKGIPEEKLDRIINVGKILNNSWTLDAELRQTGNNEERLVYYMKICCGLLEPYLEEASLVEYNQYFKNLTI